MGLELPVPNRPLRPRRSVFFMPASNARALDKARTLPADALVFDLEDAVAPDAKESARAMACAVACSGGYGRRIALANRVFAPSPEEIAWASEVMAAHAEVTAQGKGVVVVEGRLVENLHMEEAQRLAALADAIAGREVTG